MALIQDNRGFASLIQMTSVGLNIADYPTIKRAFVDKYKEIYGSDIDLTNTTADGVFVETISLMIFNILQNVKFLYSNLDIRSASGVYLESLSALSGVYRNKATKSYTQLEITNLEDNTLKLTSENNLQFVDNSGITWSTNISPTNEINIEKNKSTLIDVYCDITGPISAPKGWITQLINNELNILINQNEDAIEGSFTETDSELRSRRNATISSQGVTVLSNLRGALLNVTGIEDSVIYNNSNSTTITALDGTTIEGKSIYIVLRKTENVQIDDSIIGSIIYEKLTPGINTNNFTGQVNTGISKTYDYVQKGYGNTTSGITIDSIPVYWKECKGINTGLKVKIGYKPGEYFSSADNNSINIMRNAIKEYLNELSINQTFTTYDMVQLLNDADPLFNDKKTYNVIDVELSWNGNDTAPFKSINELGSLYQYQTKDTYFNVNSFSEDIKDDSGNIKYITFTING